MSTIRQTIESVLAPQYLSYASDVIAALEEREAQIVTAIREVASNKGLGESETEAVLVHVGLTEPAPVVVDDPVSEGDTMRQVLDTVASLAAKVEALVGVAARAGYPINA